MGQQKAPENSRGPFSVLVAGVGFDYSMRCACASPPPGSVTVKRRPDGVWIHAGAHTQAGLYPGRSSAFKVSVDDLPEVLPGVRFQGVSPPGLAHAMVGQNVPFVIIRRRKRPPKTVFNHCAQRSSCLARMSLCARKQFVVYVNSGSSSIPYYPYVSLWSSNIRSAPQPHCPAALSLFQAGPVIPGKGKAPERILGGLFLSW